MNSSPQSRDLMVRQQLQPWGITDKHVLQAFRKVPRERFVLEEQVPLAYFDCPLHSHKITLLPPALLAKMFQAVSVTKKDSLLLVGVGFGYSYAIANELAGKVVGLESCEKAIMLAQHHLESEGYLTTSLLCRDGHLGPGEDLGAFDAIVFTGAFALFPEDQVFSSLKENGRCFFFCQEGRFQQAYLIEKQSSYFKKKRLFEGQIPFLENIPIKKNSLL